MKKLIFTICFLIASIAVFAYMIKETGFFTNSCGTWSYTIHYDSGLTTPDGMMNRMAHLDNLKHASDVACARGQKTAKVEY